MGGKGSSSKKNKPKTKSQPQHRQVVDPVPETSNFQFINKQISVHLHCPQCHNLMKSPLRLHPCGHTFCTGCSPTNNKCPQCLSRVAAVQKDLTGQKLVNELIVKCLNEGCPYRDTFENYKNFHRDKCQLKVGLDEWLKGMQSSLNEHAVNKRRRYSSGGEQNENVEIKQLTQEKIMPRPPHSQRKEEKWDQQLGKQIKTDLVQQ